MGRSTSTGCLPGQVPAAQPKAARVYLRTDTDGSDCVLEVLERDILTATGGFGVRSGGESEVWGAGAQK